MTCTRAIAALAFIFATGTCFADANDDDLFARYAKNYVLADGKYEKVPDLKPEKSIFPAACEVGDTGTFRASCDIFQVIGPMSMVLEAKYPRTMSVFVMVKNYSTKNLTDGKRIDPPKLAIIGTTTYKIKDGTKTIFLAVPPDSIGLTKDQFATFLKTPGVRSELQAKLKAEMESDAKKKTEQK